MRLLGIRENLVFCSRVFVSLVELSVHLLPEIHGIDLKDTLSARDIIAACPFDGLTDCQGQSLEGGFGAREGSQEVVLVGGAGHTGGDRSHL